MMISIETIKRAKGVGEKVLNNIMRQYEIDNDEFNHYKKISELKAPDKMTIDLNNIYHGESIEWMRDNLPNKSIDMVLTSPPYDNLRDYEGYDFNYMAMIEEIYRVLKDGGICVWVVGDASIYGSETGSSFKQVLYAMDVGFYLHDTMIYEKNTSSFPSKKDSVRYTQIFEYMFVLSKGRPKTTNLICDKENKFVGDTNWGKNTARGKDGILKDVGRIKAVPKHSPRNNIWRYIVGGGFVTKDEFAHEHPAIFPEDLAKDHILSWSNEGDIVLDPMCGSGTTCKVAKLNNRKFIGIDISEKYVEISKRRIDI